MSTTITGPTVAPGGTLLRRVELPATVLTSTAYPPRLRLTPHAHTAAFLLFVRDGGFVEQHGRASERYDRLTCIYRPAYDEHANEFEGGGAVLAAIDLSPALLERLSVAGFAGERFQMRSPFVGQFGDRLDAEMTAPDAMSEMVIESLATEVIVLASRSAGRRGGGRGGWPERARRLIENEFASPLSLAAIASAVGVHRVHLARQFRAAHGCTVGEYIRRVRVEFARRELAGTDKPVAEIALAAGFFDQSQLTRTFKRVTGRTPAAYRARHR
ncbi:MAG TPA: AraC family transcriptional regulator [Thermoanaerobaculia bacterium]|nr:AraC family transcriptional regulator [Thermoanaerobaculia bacterium]